MNLNTSVKNLTKEDFFTSSELSDLSKTLGKDRYSCLVRLALCTGARESELIQLSKRDIDRSTGQIYIHATKGSDDREVRISDDLIKDLIALENFMLFDYSTAWIRMQWYKRRPESIKKRFHCFRHTFGVELYRATKDIMFVKKAMGHKSLTSTLCYVQCVDYEAKMQNSHQALANLLGQG